MITEQVVPAHAKGVAAALAEAGLRSEVTVRRSHEAVNVLPVGIPADREDRHVEALLDVLDAAGYEAHRCAPMPWLVRVTGKRKAVRVSAT